MAKKHGAKEVFGFDIHSQALECAQRNAALNNVEVSWMHRDAAKFSPPPGSPDVIILDPPSIQSSSLRGLNEVFMRHLAPNGLLFTFTCNPESALTFGQTIKDAAANVGRRSRVLRTMEAGPDHPVSFFYAQSRYLTGLLVQLE